MWVIYLRAGDASWLDEKPTVEEQEEFLRRWLDRHRHVRVLDEVVVDRCRYNQAKRPGLKRIEELFAAGKCTGVLVARLDRLSYSPTVLGQILRGPLDRMALMVAGVAEHGMFCSSFHRPSWRLIQQILGWASWDMMRRARVNEARAKESGRVLHPTVGIARGEGGRPVVVEHEIEMLRETLRLAHRWRRLNKSLIARWLISKGYKSPRGSRITSTHVLRFLNLCARAWDEPESALHRALWPEGAQAAPPELRPRGAGPRRGKAPAPRCPS